MRLNIIFVLSLIICMILNYQALPQVNFSKTVIDTLFDENSRPFDIKVEDLNGDNELDIIVSSSDNSTGENSSFFWYANDGNEVFSKSIIDSGIFSGGTFEASDLDEDLDIDLIMAASGKISWYENNGSAFFSATTFDVQNLPRNPFVTDFNSDGDKDIVYSSADGIFWARNDSTQNFILDTVESITIYEFGSFVIDVDDNLNIDVVVAIYDDSTDQDILVWYKNTGSEIYSREQIDSTVENIPQIVVNDLNDDGFKDIILIDNRESGDGIFWYKNDGNENYSRDTVSINFNRLPRSLQVTDIDGDDDKDVIVTGGNGATGEVVIYENDGEENFGKIIIDDSGGNRQRVYVADVDNDADMDLLVTNNFPFEVIFYRNDGLTGIKDDPLLSMPGQFGLKQNYPNPFNPLTKIKFNIPKSEEVKIEIFNTLGQRIDILVNQFMKAGYHEVEFNAQNLSSGIYLYRIEAGKFQDTNKMVLLR
jgi:hypothetical protein